MPGQRLILARFRADNPRIAALHPPVQLKDDGIIVVAFRDSVCGIILGNQVRPFLSDGLHGAMPLGVKRMADSMAPAAAEGAQ